jgi:hypothetical protein
MQELAVVFGTCHLAQQIGHRIQESVTVITNRPIILQEEGISRVRHQSIKRHGSCWVHTSSAGRS